MDCGKKENYYGEWGFETVDDLFRDLEKKMDRVPEYRKVFMNPQHEKSAEYHKNVALLIRFNYLSPYFCKLLEEVEGLTETEAMAAFITEKFYYYMKSRIKKEDL